MRLSSVKSAVQLHTPATLFTRERHQPIEKFLADSATSAFGVYNQFIDPTDQAAVPQVSLYSHRAEANHPVLEFGA